MDVMQVTTTTVYPPDTGGSHRSHGIICSFPEFNDRVIRVCQGGLVTNHRFPSVKPVIEINQNYIEYRPMNLFHDLASLPQALFDIPNILIGTMLRVFPPRHLKRNLPDVDVVLVEGPLQVPAISQMTNDAMVVYSSHNVEADRFAPVLNGRFGGWIHRRLSRIESRAIDRADGVICTTEADRRYYERKTNPGCPVIVAPNGIYRQDVIKDPLTNIDKEKVVDIHERYNISEEELIAIFVGSDYKPNVEAAQFLCSKVNEFAAIDVHPLIVGKLCSSLIDVPENMTAPGFVENLQGHLLGADLALNPVTLGGGSNIKMLEYFAAGLPVVSTPFGAKGFEVKDDQHLVLRDRDRFVDGLTTLSDADRRDSIGRRARRFVLKNHVWTNISRDLRSQLNRIVMNQ